jgi:hypothetical protein
MNPADMINGMAMCAMVRPQGKAGRAFARMQSMSAFECRRHGLRGPRSFVDEAMVREFAALNGEAYRPDPAPVARQPDAAELVLDRAIRSLMLLNYRLKTPFVA